VLAAISTKPKPLTFQMNVDDSLAKVTAIGGMMLANRQR
jgi:hypothetical protein